MVEIPAPNDPSGIADDNLILAIEDGIAFATINRPGARNAFARELRERVTAFLVNDVRDNPDVRVVLIQASGKSFIAGGDIKAFGLGLKMSPEDRSADMKDRAAGAGGFNALLHSLPQPVIVAARGPAVGVGASVIFAADLAIVSENAKVGLTHVGLGISPDGAGTYFLPRQVGLKRAAQVALLGEMMGADELLAMGLVNWVVPDEELDDRAFALAHKIAAGAPAAQQATKRLLREAFTREVDGQVVAEAEALGACALTDDYVEGLSAMLEKRKAEFGKTR
jgi:2-(1,2-epoxy-1,2-dihydrophenyl)acetyl-CoA isomerase